MATPDTVDVMPSTADSSTSIRRTSATVMPRMRSSASSRVRSMISAASVFTIPSTATMMATASNAYVIKNV